MVCSHAARTANEPNSTLINTQLQLGALSLGGESETASAVFHVLEHPAAHVVQPPSQPQPLPVKPVVKASQTWSNLVKPINPHGPKSPPTNSTFLDPHISNRNATFPTGIAEFPLGNWQIPMENSEFPYGI